MSALIRAFGLMVSIIFFSSLVANHADAQILRGAARLAGVLPGDGYHVCQPLTDSRYYHPYSATNNLLLTSPGNSSRVMGVAGPNTFRNGGVEFGSFPGHATGLATGPVPVGSHLGR